MKTLKNIFALVIIVLLASCEKDGNKNDNEEVNGDENEREISTNDLPRSVQGNITAQYPGSELLEADEITREDGSIAYDVEIKKDGNITELMYDAQGNFLGVEADDDDEHDD